MNIKNKNSRRLHVGLTYLSFRKQGGWAFSEARSGIMAMDLSDVIREHFNLPAQGWTDRVPANELSRQAWQEAVEQLTVRLRDLFLRQAFGLSENEISIHYHLPFRDFVALIHWRLGVSP